MSVQKRVSHDAGLDVSCLSLSASGVNLVDDVSFSVAPGTVLGIVGESGSGKSLTIMSAAGLRPKGITQTTGQIYLDGGPIEASQRSDIGVIFQDPFTSLNPVKTIGDLMSRVLRHTKALDRKAARAQIVNALRDVGIPEPETRIDAYPHELSGGQRQRVIIALALLGAPKLLVADEPTSALDPSVQRQILDLIKTVKGDAVTLFVTHDIGAAAYLSDTLAVMYAGRIVEIGPAADILLRPRHPYTAALIACTPKLSGGAPATIEGQPISAAKRPAGCAFAPRCGYASSACSAQPQLQRDADRADPSALSSSGPDHKAACFHPLLSARSIAI